MNQGRICDTKNTICPHSDRRVLFRYDQANLIYCNACGFVFSDRFVRIKPDIKKYEGFYEEESAARFNWAMEVLVRLFRFSRAFQISMLAPKAKTILDVGSGRGWMLFYLRKYFGFIRTAGTQISRNAVEFSRKKLGLEIFDRDLLDVDFGGSRFDTITIWHVLEHVAKAEETVWRIRDLLKPGGLFVVEVPNFCSWTSGWTGKYWLGLDLEYHITFFTPFALIALLEKYQFKIKRIRTFSLEYSTFISAQSILGWFTRTDQFFFQWLQNSKTSGKGLFHLILFCLLVPPCLLINLVLFFSRHGEVLRIVARKMDVTKAG
jgi:2-polyprenyl-3-methyl-5-hydroxy-6-metoxy-1,4-benzoquinol methylase